MNELCPQCGSALSIEYPMGPSMRTERCVSCSREGGGTISFAWPEFSTSRDIAGYFLLSDVSQVRTLQVMIPEIADIPTSDIVRQLRDHDMRWAVKATREHLVKEYQTLAASHGFSFVVEA